MSILNRLATRLAYDLDVDVRDLLIGLPAGLVLFLVACVLVVAMLGVQP